MDRALELFSKVGYESASVAQLSATMGMNPPSLYNAFGDKEALFVEVLDHYYRPLRAGLQQIFAQSESAPDAVRILLEAAKKRHGRPKAVGCLMVNSGIYVGNEKTPPARKIQALHAETERLIRQGLQAGLDRGDFPDGADVAKLARYLNGVLQGAAAMGRGQQSPAAVRDFLDQALEGVAQLAERRT